MTVVGHADVVDLIRSWSLAVESREPAEAAPRAAYSNSDRVDGHGMPPIAENVCQSCGKVTWADVPTRTDTMPACQCGGRRQIVRIRHTAGQHPESQGLSAADRALD